MNYVLLFTTTFAISMWGFNIWKFKLWKKFMDVFENGVSFETALAAMKQGKSIRRKGSDYGYTKITVSALGEIKDKFCSYDIRDINRFRENPQLSLSDIISNDWLIEKN